MTFWKVVFATTKTFDLVLILFNLTKIMHYYGDFFGGSVVKIHLQSWRCEFDPYVRKLPWGRK